ncbi:MAG TPA: serine hydrolase [Candidatus Limiplasma sp.]|nr:serine hydrolase [Candidatus Limiplasma sp.]
MIMTELKRVTPESVGISSRDLLSMLKELEACGTEPHGLMVTRHSKVVLECWWAPFTRETKHICHSFGKSYVATAVGAACTDGLLSVEDRIADIFRDDLKQLGIPDSGNMAKLKVKHVLTMTNGMSVHAPSGEHMIRNYLATAVDREPGSVFMYNTTGSCMLSEIVRRATGKSVYDYLKERVFNTIGINTDHLAWMTFKNGLHAAPAVASSTENNLRLGLLYLQNGRWDGKTVIDEHWIKAATSKQIDNETGGYGYQLWMHRQPGVFKFCGGHGQDSVMSRPLDLAFSIQQAGSEPHDTAAYDAVLSKYLLFKTLPDTLPEDPQAYEKLREYAASRRLPDGASAAAHGFAKGWDGQYNITNGRFHVYPELIPFGDNNVYRDFYDLEDEYTKSLQIALQDEWVEITLDGRTTLRARLDGKRIPHETYCLMPNYPYECSTAVFEKDQLIVDTWFYQTCFKTRMWFTREGDTLRLTVRKERLHDDEPYIWYRDVVLAAAHEKRMNNV